MSAWLLSPALRFAAATVGPAWLAGLFVLRALGAPHSSLHINALAGALAFALLGASGRLLGTVTRGRAALVALVVLSGLVPLTFASPGMSGVHRWLRIGVTLYVGDLIGPSLVVIGAALFRHGRASAALDVFTAVLLAFIAQPDAGQSASLVVALSLLALLELPKRWAAAVATFGCALAVASARRADRLPSVPYVENVLATAYDLGSAWGLAAALAATPLVAVPLIAGRRARRERRPGGAAGVSLAGYAGARIAVATLFNYPTPVLGYGASPILGFTFGAALLGATLASEREGLLEREEQ